MVNEPPLVEVLSRDDGLFVGFLVLFMSFVRDGSSKVVGGFEDSLVVAIAEAISFDFFASLTVSGVLENNVVELKYLENRVDASVFFESTSSK